MFVEPYENLHLKVKLFFWSIRLIRTFFAVTK